MKWIRVSWLVVLLTGCQHWPNSADQMTGHDIRQMQKAEDTVIESSQDGRARMEALEQRVMTPAAARDELPVVAPLRLDPLLDKPVDINMVNAPVSDLLVALADQLHVNLIIDPKVLKLSQRATLTMRRASAHEVLDRVFELFDIDGELKNRLLSVNLIAQKTFNIDMLASKTQLNVDDGGDVFGSLNKQSGGTSLKGNTLVSGELGGKSDPYDELMKSIQSIVTGSSQTTKSEDDSFVTVDKATGTLFVSARPSRLKAVAAFLERLRAVRGRQVQIEAQLIDVQLTDGSNLGVDWNLLTKRLIGQLGNGATTIGQAVTQVGAGGLASRSITIPSETVGATGGVGNGLAYVGNVFSATINALRTFGTVRMLSNPVVRLSNGVPAYLSVGTNYRYISNVNSTVNNIGGGSSATSVDVATDALFSGVVVGVSAFVNDVGRIELFVHPTQTQVDPNSLQQVSVGTTGSAVTLPVVDVKGITTTLKLNSGDTVILGGLISQSTTTANQGLPTAADLPVVGALFDHVTKSHMNRELVIVLRARAL
ncbi:pilus (MSHA type) biogenesis protein MshL [Burkholderia cepacia]|uniref:pilus (MSHA type) biogenesis protein MshL n=1 Tax=Burkholderia cepacia TaxID=292 RepID=UPI001589B1AB|nr:pilus (MSHA type) biogenesis protein MshL [Burkholderia cepacia]